MGAAEGEEVVGAGVGRMLGGRVGLREMVTMVETDGAAVGCVVG